MWQRMSLRASSSDSKPDSSWVARNARFRLALVVIETQQDFLPDPFTAPNIFSIADWRDHGYPSSVQRKSGRRQSKHIAHLHSSRVTTFLKFGQDLDCPIHRWQPTGLKIILNIPANQQCQSGLHIAHVGESYLGQDFETVLKFALQSFCCRVPRKIYHKVHFEYIIYTSVQSEHAYKPSTTLEVHEELFSGISSRGWSRCARGLLVLDSSALISTRK